MLNDEKTLNSLKKELVQLQEKASVVSADLRRSHESLHKHLSELYFWWLKAGKEDDYLNVEYAGLNRKFKTVGYGINFAPLLWLTWGNNNGLENNTVDRYSRALNAIHNEYENRLDLYEKDGVAKLSNFIKQAGGITKLAGYAPPQVDPTEESDPVSAQNLAAYEQKVKKYLRADANLYYSASNPLLPTLPVNDYISCDDDGYSLILVRRTKSGLKWIASKNAPELVGTVLFESYKRNFDALNPVVRPLFELVQTQCLPEHLEGFANALTDKGNIEGSKKRVNAIRRVMFQQSTGNFILSPMHAESGVVSIMKPRFKVFDDFGHDFYLALDNRTVVEQKCLQGFDFNVYDIKKCNNIARYKEPNSASHVIRLNHRANHSEFITLSFWPFYDTLPQPQDQVIINPEYIFVPDWQADLPHSWFQKLSDDFLDNWLDSHAKHLKREHQALLQITFEANSWVIQFVYRSDKFENQQTITLPNAASVTNPKTVLFLTKDWVPVLRSIPYLPVGNEVRLQLNDDVLKIVFSTSLRGAYHEIFIPTVDKAGNRSTQPFMRYSPDVTKDESDSNDNGVQQLVTDWTKVFERS